jgi:VCBS repeat-containing protein
LDPDGSFGYQPDENWFGQDSFTYRAEAIDGTSSAATVTITVTAVNDPPTGVADEYVTAEDGTINKRQRNQGVLANDTDVESATLGAAVVSLPSHGTLGVFDTDDGGFRYTPAANYVGTDSFTYQATEGGLLSAETTVTITITPVNDLPVAVADSVSTAEDTQLVTAAMALTTNDSDLETADADLVASLVTGAAHGTVVVAADGSFTYMPAPDYAGGDSFTYRVTDADGGQSDPATVSLTVTPVNDAPVAVADVRSTNEDVVLSGASVLGNDVDVDAGTTLQAVLDTPPARGTLVLNANGTFTYTPLLNDNGSVTLEYHATDGTSASGSVSVTITIVPVNDPPVAVADGGTTAEDALLSVVAPGLKANDTDVESTTTSLTASLWTQAGHGAAVVNANGSWSYTPAANYNGPDSFTYRVFDGTAFSSPGTVTITVTPVNDPPVADADSYAPKEDQALVVPAGSGVLVGDLDVDSAALTAILVTGPSRGTLSLLASGAFTYTPAANANGPDSFTYRASDGALQSSVATVSLNVTAVNDPPTFTLGADPVVLEDSGTASYPGFLTNLSPGPSDETGQTTSIAVVAASPTLFAVQPTINSAGTLSFRPATNLSGSSVVTVTVTDSGGVANGGDNAGSDSFLINVLGANDQVYANSDSWMLDDEPPAWIEAGVTTPLDVLANDVSLDPGETLTIVSATQPGHGTVTVAGDRRTLTYRSTKGYVGSDSFRYTMTDGVFLSSATVFLWIRDTLPPTLATPTARFDTGSKLTSTIKVRLGWSASDSGIGVKSYDVQQSTNGGTSWATLYSGTTATSAKRSLALRIAYTYRFRARDKGGRLSAWSVPTTFTPTPYQESTTLATYSSGWKTAFISSASGDHTKFAKSRGASTTFAFTGRAVSLVAPRSSSRGKAEIRVDGVVVATVNLYRASTDARRLVWSRSWSAVGPHVVRVRVLGTTGHPRFDVDLWAVLK